MLGTPPPSRCGSKVLSRLLYTLAVTAFLGGIGYAIFGDPRRCGIDDIGTSCGSGAKYSAALGGITLALILSYVARALRGDRRT